MCSSSLFLQSSSSSSLENGFTISDLSDVRGFFAQFGEDVPLVPATDRTLEEVLDDVDGDIWRLSKKERTKLHAYWANAYKKQFYQTQKDRFERLANEHASLRERDRARYDEVSSLTQRYSCL